VTTASPSIWRIRLVREIAAVLALKLVLLFAIKVIWFSPATPVDPAQQTGAHLLGTRSSIPHLEESPR
jgi:hypothetical protein